MAACATVKSPIARRDDSPLSGRMTVRVDASAGGEQRNLTAVFDLQGDAQKGQLNLSTPLGTMLAQARWAPGSVVLASSQGESRYRDLDALTRDVLGESLPVAALFDWLRGRSWAGAASRPLAASGERGFSQLGWDVNLDKIDEGLLAARREQAPSVAVRIKLDGS